MLPQPVALSKLPSNGSTAASAAYSATNATDTVAADEKGREGWEIIVAAPICRAAEENLCS